MICLTTRCREAIRSQPRRLRSEHVFVNPRTGKAWKEIRKLFRRACAKAELKCGGEDGLWFHDLRRVIRNEVATRRHSRKRRHAHVWSPHAGPSSSATTLISEDDLRNAVEVLELAQRNGLSKIHSDIR